MRPVLSGSSAAWLRLQILALASPTGVLLHGGAHSVPRQPRPSRRKGRRLPRRASSKSARFDGVTPTAAYGAGGRSHLAGGLLLGSTRSPMPAADPHLDSALQLC